MAQAIFFVQMKYRAYITLRVLIVLTAHNDKPCCCPSQCHFNILFPPIQLSDRQITGFKRPVNHDGNTLPERQHYQIRQSVQQLHNSYHGRENDETNVYRDAIW